MGEIVLMSALIKKKSKIIAICLILFMFTMMAFSYGNSDFETYEMYFEIYGNNLSINAFFLLNGGFKWLCSLFQKLNLTYNDMLFFMSLFGFYNLIWVAKKYVQNINVVFALLYIYPFIIDITQIRNFVSMTLLIRGIYYLITEKKNSKAIIKFGLFNSLATSFHLTFLYYFILICIRFIDRKNIKYIAPIMVVGEMILWKGLCYFIAEYTSETKAAFYFGKHIRLVTLFIIVIYYLSINIWVNYIYKRNTKIMWIANMYKINLVMLTTLPLVYHSFEFMRLYRNIFFMLYIMAANYYESHKKIVFNRKKIASAQIILISMILIAMFSLYFFIYRDYQLTVIIPAFEMNRAWKTIFC
ncbi:Uncharacterised protein [uncultured Clostridium sp.]|nr:Uncharacterised protein [uncultured Clostridium sp.]